jgi:hypothetical protein
MRMEVFVLATDVLYVIPCPLQLYTLAQRELLPTPTKSHYTFNLRDVSKVFQVCAPLPWRAISPWSVQ